MDYVENLNRLLSLQIFDKYEITGTKKRPTGLKATITFNSLSLLEGFDFVDYITINSISHAHELKTDGPELNRFYCVKMTVVIDIEGVNTQMQDIEERFVLIKAESFEDAYDKLDKQKEKYQQPYLNPDGRFVRWRIESFDDCFEINNFTDEDLNGVEGIEVYSKMKSRKRKKDLVIWDGKS